MFDLQDFIFESNPGRQQLINYTARSNSEAYKIYVYRNHSFEMIEKTISAFLDYANLTIDFDYSDYDDSLTFFDLDLGSDLLIIWLDLSRYQSDFEVFIKERLAFLKSIYKKDILFCFYGGSISLCDPQITLYDISKWANVLGEKYQDLRLEKFSGTKMSMDLITTVSKDLGLNYLPSLLKPSIKCIVLDLDNTLYRGVLGEDGINNIELTKAHALLQERLAELAKSGFFICIASKNDQRDVNKLLSERKDFLINDTNITICKASWEPKAQAICDIAEKLNIGINSILFIDDNIGELISVQQAHPEIRTILAKENAEITLEILNNYPGLFKKGRTNEDSLRSLDSKANQVRQRIIDNTSKEDFIKQMNIELDFLVNPVNEIYRISELSNKTNQFIFNYRRYTTAEIEEIMNNNVIVAVSVKDKLSESGIVGVVILKNDLQNDWIDLDECFVSCRALGRGIDDIIVLGAISVGLKKLGKIKLHSKIAVGDRNLPAIQFFEKHLSQFKSPSVFHYLIPSEIVKTSIKE
ncbi:HAD-IIIC family phosphatase [Mixta tenebrionis]|nr:HAD-IIIC family phosphatase [Mixta tenebrionis]